MESVSTTEIPTPAELARIIDGIIQQRLLIVIQQDETHLKLEQQKLLLKSTKQHQLWKSIKQWGYLINSWSWTMLLITFVFLLGLHTGLNLIAKGVVCQSRESLCYFLRFDGNKKTLKQ